MPIDAFSSSRLSRAPHIRSDSKSLSLVEQKHALLVGNSHRTINKANFSRTESQLDEEDSPRSSNSYLRRICDLDHISNNDNETFPLAYKKKKEKPVLGTRNFPRYGNAGKFANRETRRQRIDNEQHDRDESAACTTMKQRSGFAR